VNATERTLELLGYIVHHRQDGWCECLIATPGEAWLGHGSSAELALDQALAQMLPSKAAKSLFSACVAATEAEPATEPATEPAPICVDPLAAIDAIFGATAEPAPECVPDAPEPAVESEDETELPFEAPRVLSRPAAATPVPVPLTPSPPPAMFESRESRPALSLDGIERDIEDAESLDFALLAPDLMRMQMLAWAARARDVQDQTGGSATESRTRAIVQRLTQLGKRYWPGSVPALRQTATPATAAREAGCHASVRDWFDLATWADEQMVRLREGRDEYGWADGDALPPPPANPPARLGDVRTAYERLVGPVSMSGPALHAKAVGLPRASLAALVHATRVLRWLRGSVDAVAWGELMGRLRQVGQDCHDGSLREALDPAFTPPKSWALHLRSAPGKAPSVPPVPPVSDGEGALVEWLRDTADRLDLAVLRRVLRAHLDRVRGLDLAAVLQGGDFGALRRRLRRLTTELITATTDLPGEGTEDDGSSEGEAALGVDTAASETETGPTLVESARALVEGWSAIFVGNREDVELQQTLERALGLELDWRVVNHPRQIQSAADRIRQSRVDLVLLATGFIDHSSESALRDAAVASGTPVLRVGKGRLQACATAIVRGLGGGRDTTPA
jgi:hypothetical protein